MAWQMHPSAALAASNSYNSLKLQLINNHCTKEKKIHQRSLPIEMDPEP
jgi:hypothetical protein